MSGIRIIGIGSPFGDDRIGWEAIDAIDASGMLGRFPAGVVAAYRCGQPATDLLPLLSGAGAVLLIDGSRSGAPPGTLRKVDASELRADAGNLSSHGLGVPESLALARALGLLPGTTVVYGIEIGHIGAQPEISPEVLASIPALLRAIEADLRRLLRENG
ncbi:MAG: hydrogenase maturation protease [Bacillota bacterium]